MSNYFIGLLDRHLGKGEMVLPRTPARFETGTAAAYLPQDAEQDTNPAQADAEDLSVNSPAIHSTGDFNPIKQRVPVQHQPGTPIELEPGPVPPPIRGVPVRIVFPHEPPIPAGPPQESVPERDGVSTETPAAREYTTMKKNRSELELENRPDPTIQTVTRGLLQPLVQESSSGFEKPANREHTVTVNTKIQEGPVNRQSHRQPSAAPGLSPSPEPPVPFIEPRPLVKESQPVPPSVQDTGPDSPDFQAAAASLSGTYQPAPLEPVLSPEPPANGTGQTIRETVMVEPQPIAPARQDNGTGSRGLLEAPAWLAGEQSQVYRELFSMDSKAEAEPVINVTIGRIEVRANRSPAPEQPRKRKKPSGVMSLDQYLDRRAANPGR